MKKIWLAVACVVVAGFLVLALMPGNKKSEVVSGDAYRFYYYPKLNAYYDFQNGDFVYTMDGGENWQKKKPKNAKLPEKLSQKVLISGPVPDIWRYNEEHRKAHNGINTNYLSKESPGSGRDVNEASSKTAISSETAEQEQLITTPQVNEEQPLVSVKEVKITRKPVQQLPEDEWEADMQIEAERLLNEGKKVILKEVFEVDDSL
jgi:hypothetical protein